MFTFNHVFFLLLFLLEADEEVLQGKENARRSVLWSYLTVFDDDLLSQRLIVLLTDFDSIGFSIFGIFIMILAGFEP